MMIDCSILFDWWWSLLSLVGFIWAPKSWVPGELVSAASMNTNIRDHLNELLRTQTTALTGTEDDFDLEGPFVYLKCSNASALSITGALVDSGNLDGARVIVEAFDAAVTLKHEDAGSTSSNRFTNDSGEDIILGAGERAILVYESTSELWRVGKMSTGPIAATLGAVNLFPDPLFLIWPAGDAVAPAGGTLTKDGSSAIARNTVIPYMKGMSLELVLADDATVSTVLTYTIFSTLPTALRGKWISLGAAVRTDTASLACMQIDDGGTGTPGQSAFHDGGDAYSWIAFSRQLAADATKLEISFVADIGGKDVAPVSALFDAVTLIMGPSPPAGFIPPPTAEGTLYFPIIGDAAAQADKFRFPPERPLIVTNVSLIAETAPTGQALIVDVNHWDGAAYQSMFSTKPQLAASATEDGAEPDGTYRYRCFLGGKNDDARDDRILSVDIDQVGSGDAGADIVIAVHVLQFQNPLAGFMDS